METLTARNSDVFTADGNGRRQANLDLRPNNPYAPLGTGTFDVAPAVLRTTFQTDGTTAGFVNAVKTLSNTSSITYVFTNSRSLQQGNMYIGQSINGIATRYNAVANVSGGLLNLVSDKSFEVTVYVSAWPEVLEAFWIQYFWESQWHGGLTNIRQ